MYQKNDHNKISQFYKLLKSNTSHDFYGIEMKDDQVTFDKIQIMEKIQEVFAILFKDPNYTDSITRSKIYKYAKKAWRQTELNQSKFLPSDEHIDKMFQDYNLNGTTTPLGISIALWFDIWKHHKAKSILRDLIRILFQIGIYSEMDTIATTTAMPKKINSDSAMKFRPITLQSEIPKMCCQISLNVMQDLLFNHLDHSQGGAQPHISHTNQISTIYIMLKQQNIIEQPVIMGKKDIKKAFDSILHDDLATALWEKNKIQGNLFLLIANAYLNASTFMKICLADMNVYGDMLKMHNGIFQGNSQSAPLYIIVTDLIIKQFQNKVKHLPQIKLLLPNSSKWKKYFGDQEVVDEILAIIIILLIVFVDDTSIFANRIEITKQMIEKYIDDSSKHNLEINDDKTELIIFNKKHLSKNDKKWLVNNDNKMTIRGVKVPFINEVKLLGFIFNNNDNQFQSHWKYNLQNAISA